MRVQRKVAVAALAGAAFVIGARSASAAITYIDATTSNTTNADNSAFTPTTEGARSNTDNLWAFRTSAGNGGLDSVGNGTGGVYESNGTGGAGTENSPELATTITGLTPGTTYNIYTYFYDQTGNTATEWGIESGLTVGGLTSYSSADDLVPAANRPTPSPVSAPKAVADGQTGHLPTGYSVSQGGTPTVDLYQASIGSAVADNTGSIVVYVDDFATPPVSANERTRYDGVGFEASVPEPASAALLGLAAIGFTARRRRA